MGNLSSKIRIENVSKIYGNKPRLALKLLRESQTREAILQATGQILGVANVSLSIERGEVLVIVGLSGSGKSTLVRCFNRSIEPTSGQIYIDNENITRASEKRMREIRLRTISMVFQQFGLFPHKTVIENVEYGLKMAGVPAVERRQKAFSSLETVGLQQWSNTFPSSLSGGMQQRVGLARALATDAEILLMDEPFSALDPLTRRQMQEELLQLQTRLHKTIVFISHDIQEALKLGDRIAVMKEGYIIQMGTPEEIVTQPVNDYVRAFIEEVNLARVLKVGAIARPTPLLVLGRDTTQTAWEKMQRDRVQQMYVVDRHRQPVGILQRRDLQQIEEGDDVALSQILQPDFPQVKATVTIERIFPLFQVGLPIAVVNTEGAFAGAIEASDLLASLSQHGQHNS